MGREDKDYGINIEEITIAKNENCPNGAIILGWTANIGFGQWTAWMEEDGMLHVDTECLDTNYDKEFTKQLLLALLNKIAIEG